MKFVKIALLAFSGFACAACTPAPKIAPPAAEVECTTPPQYAMGLPLLEGREEEEEPYRAQAVYGAKLSDGTIVALLLQRDTCTGDWYLADSRVIEPPCPPNECI